MEKTGVGITCLALTLALVSALPVRALDASALTVDNLRVGGYSDFGRFQLNGNDVDGEIVSRVGARWRIEKQIDENFSAMADLHWLFWRNQATDIKAFHIAGLKFDADVQAALNYSSGPQNVKLGLYDFKYNPDARNLGEYLLRSQAYPTLLESSQGKDLLADANLRVAGVEYSRIEAPFFRHQALLYAEQVADPVYDLNLAYIANVGIGEKADVGAGVAWSRFAKFGRQDSNRTMPVDRMEYIKRQDLKREAIKFSLRARAELASFPEWNESLVLYGEVALLGTQSDSLYYTDITERMPIMAGVTIPTGGILSLLSVEAEYFKNPYYEEHYLVGNGTTPLPSLPDYTSPLPNYTKDDWRWSVLAHKAINKWIEIKVRCASDHLRLRNWSGDYENGRPMTQTSGEWYFMARIEYHN